MTNSLQNKTCLRGTNRKEFQFCLCIMMKMHTTSYTESEDDHFASLEFLQFVAVRMSFLMRKQRLW